LVEQLLAEGDLAGLVSFAVGNADDHTLLVDVLGTEAAQFGTPHSRGVERHQDGAVAKVGGRFDEASDLVGAQHQRDLAPQRFRQGHVVAGVVAAQHLEIQKAQGRDLQSDGFGAKSPLDKASLILADVFAAQLLGGAMEVLGEPPDRRDIGMCGT